VSDPNLPAETVPRQWEITILAPATWLTANELNNRHNRFSRSTITKAWRKAACDAAARLRLPQDLDYVRIDAVARFPGRAPVRDRDNLRPTVKAAIDGLTPAKTFVRKGKLFHSPGYALIPDDNDRHLAATDIRIERSPSAAAQGELVLIITEVKR
jgi:hypothetical protein